MADKLVDIKQIEQISNHLYNGVVKIIDNARHQVAVYVNAQTSITYWNVGRYIINELNYQPYSAYGQKILATLSQKLTERYGKGFTYSALSRMMKVARIYCDESMFATLSQTLTWSHFIELITIDNDTKRLFYQQMSIAEHWSVKKLQTKQDEMTFERSLIAAKPDSEIVKKLETVSPKHIDADIILKLRSANTPHIFLTNSGLLTNSTDLL